MFHHPSRPYHPLHQLRTFHLIPTSRPVPRRHSTLLPSPGFHRRTALHYSSRSHRYLLFVFPCVAWYGFVQLLLCRRVMRAVDATDVGGRHGTVEAPSAGGCAARCGSDTASWRGFSDIFAGNTRKRKLADNVPPPAPPNPADPARLRPTVRLGPRCIRLDRTGHRALPGMFRGLRCTLCRWRGSSAEQSEYLGDLWISGRAEDGGGRGSFRGVLRAGRPGRAMPAKSGDGVDRQAGSVERRGELGVTHRPTGLGPGGSELGVRHVSVQRVLSRIFLASAPFPP